MRLRCVVLSGALVAVASVTMAGQAPRTAGGAAAPTTSYTPPRTAWGDPDLQGQRRTVFSGFGTPLERPEQYAGREFLTDAREEERLGSRWQAGEPGVP